MDENLQPVGPEAPDAGVVGEPVEATEQETQDADSEVATETEGE